MNKNRTADDFPDPETIGEKMHNCSAVIGKKHREVACMVTVGLIIGIPMFACAQKRHGRIADEAIAKHVDVKTMGTNWISLLEERAGKAEAH